MNGSPECPDYGSHNDPCDTGCTTGRCVAYEQGHGDGLRDGDTSALVGAAQCAEQVTLEFAVIAREQAVDWAELAGSSAHLGALVDFADMLRGTL